LVTKHKLNSFELKSIHSFYHTILSITIMSGHPQLQQRVDLTARPFQLHYYARCYSV